MRIELVLKGGRTLYARMRLQEMVQYCYLDMPAPMEITLQAMPKGR